MISNDRPPALLLSSSWSMNTWSRMKLRSSDCKDASGVCIKGSRASLPPEMIWWLKISSRSHRMVKACRRTHSQVQRVSRKFVRREGIWYRPALWRRCWRLLGNAGTWDKMPSFASSESPYPPIENKCNIDIQQSTANKTKQECIQMKAEDKQK